MSELRLTHTMIKEVLETVAAHNEACRDPLVACQFLAAIIGHVAGADRRPVAQRREIIEELLQFTRHVFEDAAQKTGSPEQAFGIWRPPASS